MIYNTFNYLQLLYNLRIVYIVEYDWNLEGLMSFYALWKGIPYTRTIVLQRFFERFSVMSFDDISVLSYSK